VCAYLTTLTGVVLAAITIAYTAISPFLFSQIPQSQLPMTPGNFTRTMNPGDFNGTVQLGKLAGTPQFGNMNPYTGLMNSIVMLAVMIAIAGVLWLGLLLRKTHPKSREHEAATTRRT
jgi:hypothetical protein